MHDFLDNTDLFFELLAGIGVVCINNGSRVYKIHLGIHITETDQIFIMIVLRAVAVFAYGAAEYNVG